ncbi:exocyst complex component 3-like protein isoform X2 [Carettochelys insculpta]|uniref:exocyst complex component 3-like protein isoform X2 n=1 Tax=Carettochelys insculpta TaxID=44489 RepID=UPI003EBF08AC
MGWAAEQQQEGGSPGGTGWPEAEKAEKLARGAALKWASGVFYRPDKLEGLGHFRNREAQRTSSIQARLKSMVQSHLEGVSSGLEQLRSAAGDLQSVCRDLGAVRRHLLGSAECFRSLAPLRATATEHAQLATVVTALPQLSSVHDLLAQSLRLLRGRRLLEAHAGLMALEGLRDDTYARLHCSGPAWGAVEAFFGGLGELSEALAQQLWGIVGSSVRLAREDPALLVSAVRVIEREEGLDSALLLGPQAPQVLPPGRPKAWRQQFYQVLQDTLAAAHFEADPGASRGPELGRHLAALQSQLLAELRVVKDLMVQCCPPHYDIVGVCTRTYHRGLSDHLQRLLGRDLDQQALFLLLSWVLHVYPSSEMMAHPDLLPEVDVAALGPLLPPEVLQQLERMYVGKVQASVTKWMRRTLEVEFKEWFREEEPEMDHLGFFQSALPGIIMQMLDENIRVASLITGSLQQKVYTMALDELEAFLVSSSISTLHPGAASLAEPLEIPPSLSTALDRVQRKACRLLLEELLADLQPLYVQLPSRQWLSGAQLVNSMCEVIDKYMRDFAHVRKPIFTTLLAESEHLVMSHYIRALLEKKVVCRSAEERSQLAGRLLQDATQLRELFQHLGLAEREQSLRVIVALQELIRLQDPALLSLEVLGFATKYPDVSDEHICILLDLRGDVSKELRNAVLEMMAQNPQALPENYRPIFSNILVPAPELPFCLLKGKCA